jgi:Uncharacterized protein conserved in bacteria
MTTPGGTHMPDQPSKNRAWGYALALSQIGMEMFVPIVIGVLLDNWLGTAPWILIVGVLLGLFGGLLHLIALVNKMERAAKADQPPKAP